MDNPFTSALQGLEKNFSGLFNGQNPSFAPQITELFGFNIPGVPLISPRDYFLTQMESWFTAIPMSTQWIIVIDNYPVALRSDILQGLERTDGGKKGWDISTSVAILKSFPLQRIIGCLFANSISIPAEQFNVDSASVPNNRGFLPGIIGSNRQVDPPTLTLLQYARTLNSISMIPRKVWHFYNCMPYNIGEENYNYTDEVVNNITTRWTYSNYTIESGLYLPVQDLVNRISNGDIPRVTSFQNGIGSINPLGFL